MSTAKGAALVTGSAQGIGRGIALRLASDGFDVALNDIPSKRDQLRAVADDIEKMGRRAHLVLADVSVEAEVKGMIQSTTEELGGLDVMVANAGVAELSDLISTGVDQWERIMGVNARGVFLCYKHAAIRMIAQGRGGRIIGASSIGGKFALPLGATYCASKFAIRGLTQTAALELGRYNITVNSYAPGLIDTPMYDDVFQPGGIFTTADQELTALSKTHMSRGAIKRKGQPEDVASIVSYLVSKEAHFITGQCITVDGGIVMS